MSSGIVLSQFSIKGQKSCCVTRQEAGTLENYTEYTIWQCTEHFAPSPERGLFLYFGSLLMRVMVVSTLKDQAPEKHICFFFLPDLLYVYSYQHSVTRLCYFKAGLIFPLQLFPVLN